MKTRYYIYIVFILIFILIFVFAQYQKSFRAGSDVYLPPKHIIPPDYIEVYPIEAGSTFGMVMNKAGVPTSTVEKFFSISRPVYDLSNIKAEHAFYLTYDKKGGNLKKLMYPVSDIEELYVTRDSSTTTPDIWEAKLEKINYNIQLKTYTGEIESSLYEDGLKLGINEGTIIEFADMFEYAIDYAYDVRTGDKFKFVVEERYRDDKYVMPGRILTGKFVNASTTLYAHYFEESQENAGYFDENGNSLQKMFLRAPVAFRYISSGFTTGSRYISAFNISTGHRAIDYATPAGTPIRSVGDGTVIFAGWSKAGYGRLTSIRHNGTYTTNYAHQSKIIVKTGQRVRQGQTIGYVGSTGLSTGPHLHYEMVKNGVKINPLREVLPPGKPILPENLKRFQDTIDPFKKMLDL